jgi:hypothetical protein
MTNRSIEERLEGAFGTDMTPPQRAWLDERVRAAIATTEVRRRPRWRIVRSLLLVGALLVLAPTVLAFGTGILPLRNPHPNPSTAAASVVPSRDPNALTLALYVHLEGTVQPRVPFPKTVWFAMGRGSNVDPYRAVGFDHDGVGCFDMTAGDELGLYDRNPADPGAQRTRLVATVESGEPSPIVLWVDIAKAGDITQGMGVPGWWDGGSLC